MFRRPSQSKLTGAAQDSVIPDDLGPAPEELPLESLAPRDLKVSDPTATSVNVTYTLPPTSTKIGGAIHVRVLVRPSKIYRECLSEAEKVEGRIRESDREYSRKQLRMKSEDRHQAFVDHNNVIFAMRREQDEIWARYTAKCKELLQQGESETRMSALGGWFVFDPEAKLFSSLQDETDKDGVVTVRNSSEKQSVLIENLQSNYFFDISACARRADVKAAEDGRPQRIFSPRSSPVGCSTKTAPWQLALEKGGLRHLIEPFSENGLASFDKWVDIPQEKKMELGVDAAVEQTIQEILSSNGFMTPQEEERLAREKVELAATVGSLLSDLKKTQDQLSTGDGVTEKVATNKRRGARFGVVVEAGAKECSVRFEDPRTKDTSNAQVETVKTSNLVPTKFSMFLSHAQSEAQNQVAHLSVLLRDQNAKIWFDMDSERLEAHDMVRGIFNSKVFVLYLTRTYLDRWFCRMEISVAQKLQKQIIIVYEPDERHGGMGDYISLVEAATRKFPEFKEVLKNTEAIPMARRSFQRRAVVTEIAKRAGLVSRPGSFTELGSSSSSLGGSSNVGLEISDLKQMVLDLRMEMSDLRAENNELRKIVEDMRM